MKKSWDHIRTQENVVPDSLKTQPYDNQNTDMNKIIAERAKTYKTPFQGSENMRNEILGHKKHNQAEIFRPGRARQGGGNHARRLNPFGQVPLV